MTTAPRHRRHWRRWLLTSVVALCISSLAMWRDHVRQIHTHDLTHEIQMQGGKVYFGPTLMDDILAWWSESPPIIWDAGTMVTLFDTQLDTSWLRQHDDLDDLPITYLYLGASTLTTDDAVRIIDRHPLQTYSAEGQQEADTVAAALGHKSRLSVVGLAESDLTDAGLRQLPLEQLESLCIEETRVTADGLSELCRCRELNFIHLDGDQLDEAVVATLTKLPALERVVLVGGNVNDDNVRLMVHMQDLPFLELLQTSVTEAGAENLTAAMPATVIGRQ